MRHRRRSCRCVAGPRRPLSYGACRTRLSRERQLLSLVQLPWAAVAADRPGLAEHAQLEQLLHGEAGCGGFTPQPLLVGAGHSVGGRDLPRVAAVHRGRVMGELLLVGVTRGLFVVTFSHPPILALQSTNTWRDTPMPRRRKLGWSSDWICLLYTSDAADEEDSVDLGGRRIIKKKKK